MKHKSHSHRRNRLPRLLETTCPRCGETYCTVEGEEERHTKCLTNAEAAVITHAVEEAFLSVSR